MAKNFQSEGHAKFFSPSFEIVLQIHYCLGWGIFYISHQKSILSSKSIIAIDFDDGVLEKKYSYAEKILCAFF